eukprot:1152052-Pelagomonas_calceolata.AAC.8
MSACWSCTAMRVPLIEALTPGSSWRCGVKEKVEPAGCRALCVLPWANSEALQQKRTSMAAGMGKTAASQRKCPCSIST